MIKILKPKKHNFFHLKKMMLHYFAQKFLLFVEEAFLNFAFSSKSWCILSFKGLRWAFIQLNLCLDWLIFLLWLILLAMAVKSLFTTWFFLKVFQTICQGLVWVCLETYCTFLNSFVWKDQLISFKTQCCITKTCYFYDFL